jgi:hypothetical protein
MLERVRLVGTAGFLVILSTMSIICFDHSEKVLRSEFAPIGQNMSSKASENISTPVLLEKIKRKTSCIKIAIANSTPANEADCESKIETGALRPKVLGNGESGAERNQSAKRAWSIDAVAGYLYRSFYMRLFISPATFVGSKSDFILALEWVMLFCLIGQLFVVFLSHSHSAYYKKNENRFFFVTDWALNSPPVIGVLANLFAFAQMLATGVSSINGQFLKFFGEAVTTTILGGSIYVVLLLSRAFTRMRK